ncbi:MAG: hypothetical protein ACKOC5_15200 [Chloroflexota bacterium]
MPAINSILYEQYLRQYLALAIRESDGTNRGIAERLGEIHPGGLFERHKDEKRRALQDARRAFDEHRHWPLDIVLSHLGIRLDELRRD